MQLHTRSALPFHTNNAVGDETSAGKFDVDRLLGMARRQWLLVAYCACAGIILGLVYIFNATPMFTAQTSVMIDRSSNTLLSQYSAITPVLDDEGSVLSQVELLKSESISLAVVDKLKLYDDPVFNADGGSLVSTIKAIINVPGWFSSDEVTAEQLEAKRQAAADKIGANLDVQRVGRTYVLSIIYTSASPDLAARIANAIGEAYLTDKLDSKFEATRRASEWLQQRIGELSQKAQETDLAVQKFRADNGLVSNGTILLSDQQLSELNSALISAQAETGKARARSERVQSIIASGQIDAIVTDVLDSSVSNELRKKYLEAEKREQDISKLLGPDHIQAVRLRDEMDGYKRLMFGELNRIGESYKSDLEVAQAREDSLRRDLANATGVSTLAGETQVRLRELEREAESYKNLHQSFLQRYQEALQQQSFPVTDARIISNATVPEKPSSPKKPLALALFLFLGIAAGGAAGAFREYRDRFFRTGEQIRSELGLEFLGMAPLIKDVRELPQTNDDPTSVRKLTAMDSYVIDHPLSTFSEALRSAKIAADMGLPSKQCKIIGIVSTLPGEGKSTVAVNFAELMAMQGARTLLIDADLRNPGATRALARHADAGILEALLEGRPIQDLLLFNRQSKLAFLPAVVKQRVPHSSELLASNEMQRMLAGLSGQLDYIILDLPPLTPVVDARAMASRIDGFVYVVEWGNVSRRTVRHTLENEPTIAEKCLGVILNKVDLNKMKLYRTPGSVDYYYSRYSRYYSE